MTTMLHRLPEAMKARVHWALAGASKAPLSVDANGKLYHTSVNRPGEWLSFEQLIYYMEQFKNVVTTHVDKKGRTITQTGLNGGYILSEVDEFTIIDLDVKDAQTHPDEPELWTTPDQFQFYWNIVQHINTYTERSRSGKGLHLVAQGKIGAGFRRDGIEVYSQERFIICTGDVVIDQPVAYRQDMLNNMVSQMRPMPKDFQLEELPELEDDWSILTTAINAANSDKFVALWKGEWRELQYPSQSEADLALMSMFTFYSPSNEQCRRLFRDSALGKREKAVKDDRYLNLTLRGIRERMFREARAELSAMKQSAELVQQLAASSRAVQSLQAPSTSAHSGPPVAPALPPPSEVTIASLAPVSNMLLEADKVGTDWPPGFAGMVAKFIYQSAPRPVKEVAIVAALGLLAGITGKAWHIPQSGLNLYIILVAKSAVGKEAMHSGINAIVAACSKDFVNFRKFVDSTNYVSGPALLKAVVVNQSFVNVNGEWGRKLQRLAEDQRDGALQTLRTVMTDLYQKSGPNSIVGGMGYSSQDNNVLSVENGVNFSMIGETTPGTFYKALTETMMEDGFLSRFLVMEYNGERPPENEYQVLVPDPAMVKALNNLAMQADSMIMKQQSMPIGRTEEAAALAKQFDLECDHNINASTDESKRQMWSRAALKTLRIAGVLAVSDNWHSPCITIEHLRWAQAIVRQNIAIMKRRLDAGDVGDGDDARERKLAMVMKEYLSGPVKASYKVNDAMRANGIVPRSYLQTRINRVPTFSNHRAGANRALEDSLQAMVGSGYLIEIPKGDKLIDPYGYHGRAYRVVKLPDYDAD